MIVSRSGDRIGGDRVGRLGDRRAGFGFAY